MARRPRDPEARIEALEERLERCPSSAAFFPLASLLWEKGEAERAEDLLRKGLLAHPDYAAAGVLLGEILLAGDAHEEAARHLEKALELTPWNVSGRRLLATCHQMSGDAVAALAALEVVDMFESDEEAARKAMGDSGDDAAPAEASDEGVEAVATPSLAELYLAQGHPDRAAAVYERLLDADPQNAEWKAKLAVIRERVARGEERAAPTGYPGMDGELDLIAGETEDAAEASAEPRDAAPLHAGAEDTRGALPEALPVRAADAAREEEEAGAPPGEESADSILMRLIELYVEEGDGARALDVGRKARALGLDSLRLQGRISALEEEQARSARETVEALERWLAALRRRKAGVRAR